MARAAERAAQNHVEPKPAEEPDDDPRTAFWEALQRFGLKGEDLVRAFKVGEYALGKLEASEPNGDGWWRGSVWVLTQGWRGVASLARRKPESLFDLVDAWADWAKEQCFNFLIDGDVAEIADHFEVSWERVQHPFRFLEEGALRKAMQAAADDPPPPARQVARDYFAGSPIIARLLGILLAIQDANPGQAIFLPTRLAAELLWKDATARDRAGRMLRQLVRHGVLRQVEEGTAHTSPRYEILLRKSVR